MGPRGRDRLTGFLNQRADRVLADRAWRILHAPQSGWQYVPCTEAEAATGYRQHPKVNDWAPVPAAVPAPEPERMPYLAQTFDGFAPRSRGPLGDYFAEGGQWRGLSDVGPAPVLQTETRRGTTGNAVRLERVPEGAGSALEGMRADCRLSLEPTCVELWVWRATPETAFAVTWKDSGANVVPVGAVVAADGTLSCMGPDGKWSRTATRLAHGTRQRLRLEVDGTRSRYSLSCGTEATLAPVAADIAFAPGARFNILTVSPQLPAGGVLYVDDVLVTLANPAPRAR